MDTTDWLLDSEPAIRWQAMRDLTDASPATISEERARVPREGIGAGILACQGPDGSWHRADASDWLPNLFTMQLLRAAGVDPADPAVASAVSRLEAGFRWAEEFGAKPFFEGEVEPCINGGALALGAYFGRPSGNLARRLASEQLDDGGWNCEAPKSTRSSFHTTICVLEGLLEYERAARSTLGSAPEITAARKRGGEYFLKRRCFDGSRPARWRIRSSSSSRSRPATTTTFSARLITSGTPLHMTMFNPTHASTMPFILSRANGKLTADGFSIARTTRRWPCRPASQWVNRAGGTRSERCGFSIGTKDEGSRRRALHEPGISRASCRLKRAPST